MDIYRFKTKYNVFKHATPQKLLLLCLGLCVCIFLLQTDYLLALKDGLNFFKCKNNCNKDENLNDRPITVISAYFYIGKFQKGTNSNYFYTKETYVKWLSAFSLVRNPLILFVEKGSKLGDLMKEVRRRLPIEWTLIVELETSEMWAFKLLPNISRIFSRPNYPQHSPNTMLPKYVAIMNAKYELMRNALLHNPFNSRYFSWLDIGLFRNIAINRDLLKLSDIDWKKESFELILPPDFRNDSHIGYTQMNDIKTNLRASSIVTDNLVWLCGAYFVGRRDLMLKWTDEYRWAVSEMLKLGWISTDQQVIYWTFSNANATQVTTKIQGFKGDGRVDPWFHLGYISRQLEPPN